jgi:uncharacterized membrane protein
MTTPDTPETITVRGITYEVVVATTPDEFDAQGLRNLARHMRGKGATRDLALRRPAGNTMYSASEFVGGGFSIPFKIGKW